MKAIFLLIFILSVCNMFTLPGTKPGTISKFDTTSPGKHISHEKIFGKTAPGYNKYILKAVDKIQGQVMNGGGYYTNLKDRSRESPIGYELKIFNHSLITPPRQSSYCTGATFAAFIEALNLIYPEGDTRLTLNRYEALRMQEMNGSRREDFVKVWGNWNSQWGTQYVLVKYLEMGKIVSHGAARPGDFINILFKAGGGHSAVFLGWNKNDNGEIQLMYWSSQPETNGISDHIVSIGKIAKLAVVRLTDPGKIFSFDAAKKIFFQQEEFAREVEMFLLNE